MSSATPEISVPRTTKPQKWWRRGRSRPLEQLFLENLDLVERAARSAGRRSGFSPEDVDDFVSSVKLKLIEDDYAVVREYRGDSKLSTYLVTVIHNLCRDYRNHLWGKFQPSAEAKRLGTTAMILERLLVRDGLDLATAIEMAKGRFEVPESREELDELAGRLPPRLRRFVVGEEALEERPETEAPRPEKRVEDSERAATAERVTEVLDEALRALEPRDLLILKMHLGDGRTLAAIARDLHLEQRRLYNRKDRCFRQLHEHFTRQGLTWDEVRTLLGWREHDLSSLLTDGSVADLEKDQETAT